VEEVGEVWTRQRKRSVVPIAVPERFDVEEQQGNNMEAHMKDTEEGAQWRRAPAGVWRGNERVRV
jgi:hypothetical protein